MASLVKQRMVQAASQLMSFQEFLAWKPETGRFELHDGVIVAMQPTGPHVREASPQEIQVVDLLNRKLNVLIDQVNLAAFIVSAPTNCSTPGHKIYRKPLSGSKNARGVVPKDLTFALCYSCYQLSRLGLALA
ncbi:MAG: hypothetical protein AAFW95_08335 [Cyanobacteria bacterium J06638_6]